MVRDIDRGELDTHAHATRIVQLPQLVAMAVGRVEIDY